MGNKIRNINRPLVTSPHVYDGYDVLHHTMKKTLEGSTLLPGFYKGKVISVKRTIDPNQIHLFEVMAWIPQIHTSIPEPEIYSLVEIENLHGMKFYKPISEEAEEPCTGMVVDIFLEDPSNAIGYYFGISNQDIDLVGERNYIGNTPIHSKLSAKKSMENKDDRNGNNYVQGPVLDGPSLRNETMEQQGVNNSTEQKSSAQLLKEAKKRITDIQELQPEAREKMRALLERLKQENLPFQIWETRRTLLRQKYLYTKNRTTEQVRAAGITEFEGDPKQPWATGTLKSNHLGGFAMDMVLDKRHPYFRGKKKPDNPWDLGPEFMPLWRRYRKIANEVGLKTFGTDWPHVSLKRG